MPRCPACFTPMTRIEQHNLKLFTCSNCFGTLATHIVLTRLVRRDAQAAQDNTLCPTIADASLADLASVVAESHRRKQVRCPECSRPMAAQRFHPMIPVTIDRCSPCENLFLDPGELNLLRKLYAEMATSTDPEIVRLREKIAGTQAAWAGREKLGDNVSFSTAGASNGIDLADLARALLRL